MKNAVLIGSDSDIAKAIAQMLLADGYSLANWSRGTTVSNFLDGTPHFRWDVAIIFLGRVAPVGNWWEQDSAEWEKCYESNIFLPLRILRKIWPRRKDQTGSTVIWMAGSNPQSIMNGYSAYCGAKMSVLKLVEQLNQESEDTAFVALGPGVCDTKIHQETIARNWNNARLARALEDGSFTKMEDVYACMMWCINQPKDIVGGTNICVSDSHDWECATELEDRLTDPSMFKLRRVE